MLPPVRRAKSPLTSSTAGSVVGEDHLHGLLRPLVHELVRLGRAREGDAMGDQRAEKELAEQRERDVEPPLTVPARRERGIELGDLRAHETKPTAMEARAEVKAHGLGAYQEHTMTEPWNAAASIASCSALAFPLASMTTS